MAERDKAKLALVVGDGSGTDLAAILGRRTLAGWPDMRILCASEAAEREGAVSQGAPGACSPKEGSCGGKGCLG